MKTKKFSRIFALKLALLFLCLSYFGYEAQATQAKTKVVRKVQEVNFSETSLKGTVRNPDGAYLVQKRGIKFMPLHDLQKDMDGKIREAVNYVD